MRAKWRPDSRSRARRGSARTIVRPAIVRPAIVRPVIVALTAAALLAACGFQLEGHTPLPKPLKVSYVEAKDKQTEFVQGLRKALLAAGVRLTGDSSKATAVVHVLADTATPRVLAVSSADLPREYEITYTVRVSVTADGKDLLAPEEITVRRDYSFDEYVLLAKDNEDAILRAALARDLVGIVMRRLARL
jgi:LPS-assembly lipoprotein